MTDYRDEFPVTGQWAFFNHAAVGPLSRRAWEKVREWSDDMATHGDAHVPQWWQEIETVRATAARLIGAAADEIALLKNTSEGLALVAEGFPWKPGDNVVIADGEFPANVYPWLHLRDKGVEVKTVPVRGARIDKQDIEAAMDERTRLLSLSYVQYATGFRSDLTSIGRLCRERGIDFCVDAIQGMGVFEIDVQRMQIDYLSADGHKWLVSPEGASVFYIARDKLDNIRPTSVGWKSVAGWTNYDLIDFQLRPNATRFENGTFNIVGTIALGASLTLFEEVGIARIAERVRKISDYLIECIGAVGGTVISPRDNDEWSGIVSFTLPDRDLQQLVRQARQQHVALSFRGGRLRASPHFYTNRADVDRLISVLERL